MTTDEINELIAVCNDPISFIERIFTPVPTVGSSEFRLHDYQKVAIRKYQHNKKTVGMWARGMGCSTTTIAYLLWYAIRHWHVNIGIISPTNSHSSYILHIIKSFLDFLPNWAKPKIERSNSYSIEFDNGSKIILMNARSASQSVRGRTFNILYMEEAAFMREFYEILMNVEPCLISTSGKLIISSGFNEYGNEFLDYYNMCNHREKLKVRWSKLKTRNKDFKEDMILKIGKESFNRQFELKV